MSEKGVGRCRTESDDVGRIKDATGAWGALRLSNSRPLSPINVHRKSKEIIKRQIFLRRGVDFQTSSGNAAQKTKGKFLDITDRGRKRYWLKKIGIG